MKRTNNSILGKYSDNNLKKKKDKTMSPMVTYEQRYKGDLLTKEVTEPVKPLSISERLAKKEEKDETPDPLSKRVSVTIGDNTYLLGCNEEISESRIRKIAALADEIYKETKENNPYIATNKTAILSLIECCDRYLSLKEEVSNLRTEVMFYKQKDMINEEKTRPEPTPIEKLSLNADGDIND